MTEITDAVGTRHEPASGTPRIVSLVPSLTELLCDLGLADVVVGRTVFCVHPREVVERIPAMGGTKHADIERIRAAAPTHLVVDIDENRREQVHAIARFVPHVVVTHPRVPEDNLGLYRLFGRIFRREAAAERLAAAFLDAREELRHLTASLPRLRVLYLIWKNPWMTVSRATYVSAMLAAAGLDTVPAWSAVRYPMIDPASLEPLPPDRVLLASEPYRFTARHLAEAESCFAAPAALVDGELVAWFGSRAIGALRYLARYRTAQADATALQTGRGTLV